MAEPWDELQYRELFEAFPLSGGRPSGEALLRLARRLDRSSDAIAWQWDDCERP